MTPNERALPELPSVSHGLPYTATPYYTADQMRAYATAAVEAALVAGDAACVGTGKGDAACQNAAGGPLCSRCGADMDVLAERGEAVDLCIFLEPVLFWRAQSAAYYKKSKAESNEAEAVRLLSIITENKVLTTPPAAVPVDALRGLVDTWLFDGYLTGNPKIDEPTQHRQAAKQECAADLIALLDRKPQEGGL